MSYSSKSKDYDPLQDAEAVQICQAMNAAIPNMMQQPQNILVVSQWYADGQALWNGEQHRLQPGDIIEQKLRLVWHNLVYTGQYNGAPRVISRYTNGIMIEDLTTLRNNFKLIRVNNYVDDINMPRSPQDAITTAVALFNDQNNGPKYHLMHNNCCHLANSIRNGLNQMNRNDDNWRRDRGNEKNKPKAGKTTHGTYP